MKSMDKVDGQKNSLDRVILNDSQKSKVWEKIIKMDLMGKCLHRVVDVWNTTIGGDGRI